MKRSMYAPKVPRKEKTHIPKAPGRAAETPTRVVDQTAQPKTPPPPPTQQDRPLPPPAKDQ